MYNWWRTSKKPFINRNNSSFHSYAQKQNIPLNSCFELMESATAPEVSKKVEEAKAKLRHGVEHIRNMQSQVRNMFQFCCLLGFGYSLFRLSTVSTGFSDIFNLIVSLALTLTVKKNVMVSNNWSKLFIGLISVAHLALFLACVPISYSAGPFSEYLPVILDFRSRYVSSAIDNVVCFECGQQLPVSFVLYIVILLSDRYMDKTYRKTSESYSAMIKLGERLEKERNAKATEPCIDNSAQKANNKKNTDAKNKRKKN
jgi:hypothetical protein